MFFGCGKFVLVIAKILFHIFFSYINNLVFPVVFAKLKLQGYFNVVVMIAVR